MAGVEGEFNSEEVISKDARPIIKSGLHIIR